MGERLSLKKTVFVFRYWFDMNSVQGLQRRMVLVDSFSNFLNYYFVALCFDLVHNLKAVFRLP